MTETAVRQVMTTPVMTVEPDEILADVAWAMREKEIKSLAVIDESCRPLGILTSTDFVEMAAEQRAPAETTVGEHMTERVVTTSADTTVAAVTDDLLAEGFNHMPVVEDDEVVGILSTTDILSHLSNRR